MPLQRFMPWLVAALALSVAGMTVGAALLRVWLVTLCAGTFASVMLGAALSLNMPYWRTPGAPHGDAESAAVALRQNTRLGALVFVWGAIAMQCVYATPLTGLRWQHAWQYALLMVLVAMASFRIADTLGAPPSEQRTRWIRLAVPASIAMALLAASGLVYLVASGKLLVRRADWAANVIFLFGSFMVMVLGAVTLRTHDRLTR